MNKKSSWFMGAICGAVLAFGLSVSGYAISAGSPSASPMGDSMSMKIQMAKSKADHEALAAQYENEAKELQAKADEHKEMAKQYAGTHWTEKHDLGNHCKKIAQKYEDAAKENLALAKIHRGMAEKAN